MVASSFNAVPGLPILHSKDLVSWRLIGHALPRLVPEDLFSTPQHGKGPWAPAIRHHDGRFWIYYPEPDLGIYVVTAKDPAGPWSQPVLVKGGKGLIDPCPLWDDDGQVYLVHAWARSRAGFANVLTLNRLSADGLKTLDEGTIDHQRRSAARIPDARRSQAVQARWLLLDLRAGRRREERLAVGLSLTIDPGTLRGSHRARAGRDRHQRAAPGRLARDAFRRALVHPLPGQGRLRPHRPARTDGVARGRLAGDGRRPRRGRQGRARARVAPTVGRQDAAGCVAGTADLHRTACLTGHERRVQRHATRPAVAVAGQSATRLDVARRKPGSAAPVRQARAFDRQPVDDAPPAAPEVAGRGVLRDDAALLRAHARRRDGRPHRVRPGLRVGRSSEDAERAAADDAGREGGQKRQAGRGGREPRRAAEWRRLPARDGG